MFKITKDILLRVSRKETSLASPCVICGVKFSECPHDVTETAFAIKRVKSLTRGQREIILSETP